MNKARVRLPPMSTLEAFDAAARLRSFSAAAQELNLTPGAVSRQIAHLESDLGVELFSRGARGVDLTPSGQRLHLAASEALSLVFAATRGLRMREPKGTVRLSLTPSFGVHWLLPRLSRFRAIHPNIEIVPIGENRLVDLRREGIDLAVRYTALGYTSEGVEALPWLSEELVPVAAPALLKDRPRTPDGLVGLQFLHDSSDAFWRHWLAGVGRSNLLPSEGLVFNDYNLAIGAAISGIGVLMGRTALIENELKCGRLIEAVPLRIPSPRAYHLVRPSGPTCVTTQAVWNWLSHVGGAIPPSIIG